MAVFEFMRAVEVPRLERGIQPPALEFVRSHTSAAYPILSTASG
jgi:hypothetical protein